MKLAQLLEHLDILDSTADPALEITGDTVVVDGITWVSVRTFDGLDGWIIETALRTATPEAPAAQAK